MASETLMGFINSSLYQTQTPGSPAGQLFSPADSGTSSGWTESTPGSTTIVSSPNTGSFTSQTPSLSPNSLVYSPSSRDILPPGVIGIMMCPCCDSVAVMNEETMPTVSDNMRWHVYTYHEEIKRDKKSYGLGTFSTDMPSLQAILRRYPCVKVQYRSFCPLCFQSFETTTEKPGDIKSRIIRHLKTTDLCRDNGTKVRCEFGCGEYARLDVLQKHMKKYHPANSLPQSKKRKSKDDKEAGERKQKCKKHRRRQTLS